MKHVLILRALGFVLIIALAVNITAVLAAPFYFESSDPKEEAIASAERPPAQDQQSSADADDHGTDAGFDATDATDNADRDAVATMVVGTTENTLIVIDGDIDIVQSDTPVESDSVEQSQSMSDPDTTVTLPPTDDSEQPWFTATVQSKSEGIFFDLGSHIASRSHHRSHPIANVASRFVRRSSPNVENTQDEDLLPTVVISDEPQPEHSETPVDVTIDATEAEATNDGTVHPDVSTPRIVLKNSTENYTVWFELNGTVQSLKPGALLIETSEQSVVRFDRGGSFGESRQELATGRYQFRVTREGWKLEEAKEDATSL